MMTVLLLHTCSTQAETQALSRGCFVRPASACACRAARALACAASQDKPRAWIRAASSDSPRTASASACKVRAAEPARLISDWKLRKGYREDRKSTRLN